MVQLKKGALRGIRGIEFYPWTQDAQGNRTVALTTPNFIPFNQNATQEAQVTEGETVSLTGSGKNVVTIKDPDRLDGYNVGFSSALADLEVAQRLVGGQLITNESGTTVGWNPPNDLADVPYVYMRIYVQNYDSDNNASGYMVLELPFVRCGYPTLPEITETDFLRLDFTAFASRNPLYDATDDTPAANATYNGPVAYRYINDAEYPAGLKTLIDAV